MKKLRLITFILAGLLVMVSCEDSVGPVINDDTSMEAPVVSSTAHGSSIMLTSDNADSEAMSMSWSPANIGVSVEATYIVQMDTTGNNFADAIELATGTDTSFSITVADLNSKLLAAEYAPDETVTMDFRVVADINSDIQTMNSDPISVTLTPYNVVIDYPMIYVPGEYQGWSPGADNGRLYSYNFDNVYEGILRLTDDNADGNVEFKVAPAPNWDNSWGGTLTDGSGTLDPSGGNFSVTPGTYAFTVDVGALTISIEATDDWGIIGNAVPVTGWDSDVNMTYNGQMQVWEWTGDLVAGEFKFRANDDWGLNYGDTGADGSLDNGGDNMVISADGNYTLVLDLNNNTYSVTQN